MPATRRADARDSVLRPDLAEELLRRRDADQAGRAALRPHDAELVAALKRMDDENTTWLRTVVDAVGWPGRALVGDEAAHAAWLLVQHADRALGFQRRCLTLLERAAAAGDASPADAAHLADRVLLASGEMQVYGTQLGARDGRYVAPRLRDPASVDERRAAAGLGSLDDHLARALALHGPPKPAPLACPGCKARIDVWLPELGGRTEVTCTACGRVQTLRAHMR